MQMSAVIGEALVDLVGQQGSRRLVAQTGGGPVDLALGLGRGPWL
jgi:fructokinase